MKNVEHRIRRHWPYRMALKARTVSREWGHRLVVSALYGFTLDEHARIVTEPELWDFVHAELAEEPDQETRLDRWTMKATGELLIAGKAHGLRDEPARVQETRTQLWSAGRRPVIDRRVAHRADTPDKSLHDAVDGERERCWQEPEPWGVQLAPEAQRLPVDTFFRGGERVRLTHLHPQHPQLEVEVPRWRVRGYARCDTGWEPLVLRCDTVQLYPARDRGVVIHRAVLPVTNADAVDVSALVVGIEDPDSEPRGRDDYLAIARQDAEDGIAAIRYDGRLLPDSMAPKQRCEDCAYADLGRARLRAERHTRLIAERDGAGDDIASCWYCERLSPDELERRGYRFHGKRLPLLQKMGCDWGTPRVGITSAKRPSTTTAAPAALEASLSKRAATPSSMPAVDANAARPTAATRPPSAFERVAEEKREARLTGRSTAHMLEGELSAPHMARGASDYIDAQLMSADFDCSQLELQRIEGREAISQLFGFTLDVVCNDPAGLPLKDMVGAHARLIFSWALSGQKVRCVHGMIRKVDRRHDLNADFHAYRFHLVPRAWRCSLPETQEMFLDKSIVDIIRIKLARAGLVEVREGAPPDVEFRLTGQYPVRECVTQYRESDLAFICRLAEHAGISFSFCHDDDVDRMVFSDHQGGFPRVKSIPLRLEGDRVDIYGLLEESQLIPSSYEVHDYNYRTPLVQINARHELNKTQTPHRDTAVNRYGTVVEYGGHHRTPDQGAALAKVRAQERRASRTVYRGDSNVCHLATGCRFELDDSPLEEPLLLVTEVTHQMSRVVRLHGARDEEHPYSNTFVAVPGKPTYRPPRNTPRPRIHGLLTAIIEHDIREGAGYWARLDEQGRYTMRILFDTAAHQGDHHDGKQSRWTRMLQPHSGPNYGMHWPLKPGTEVALAFIDGDPDRPIVVGAVPNPVTPSPVTQANHRIHQLKTVSGCHIEVYDAPEPPPAWRPKE